MIRYGTSWPGKRPGTRHWVSFPLTGPMLLLLPGAVLFWLGFWGIIGMCWLSAEALAVFVSALVVVVELSRHMAHPRDITVARYGWLYVITLRRAS